MTDTERLTEITFNLSGYELVIATDFGPRLVEVRPSGGPQILARLDPSLTVPGSDFRLRGGHRLWAAPETPSISYAGDDHPCQVEERDARITVSAPPDRAGLVKEITVWAEDGDLVLDHRLTWTGGEPIAVAPWAITQVPVGGDAIVPLLGSDGGSPLRADRSLVLWPYTDLTDRRLQLLATVAVVTADNSPSAFKIGSGPAPGRIGYLRDGWLLTKTVEPAGDGVYADRGAVAQVYANHDFCELESLGPVVDLSTGDGIGHRERWNIEPCPDLDTAVARLLPTP